MDGELSVLKNGHDTDEDIEMNLCNCFLQLGSAICKTSWLSGPDNEECTNGQK